MESVTVDMLNYSQPISMADTVLMHMLYVCLTCSPIAPLSGKHTGGSVSRFLALVVNGHPSHRTAAVHSAWSE